MMGLFQLQFEFILQVVHKIIIASLTIKKKVLCP